jgi:opacity protein-like surface antigen
MIRPPAPSLRPALAAAALAVTVLAASAAPAAGQGVIDVTDELDFDEPESWAMAWFGSVTLLTGFGVPEPLDPGALELGLEAGWVPSLSEEQRRVGFGGTKVEDLNRTPAIGRPRLTVGLPGGFALTGAWIPPVEIDDVETNLFALGLARELWARDRSRGGVRLYGQTGTVEGAITCTAGDAASVPGSEGNPFGCEAPSDDELTLTYYGLELSAAYRAAGGAEPYLAAAVNRFDNEFQVDAFTFGLHDRTLLLAEGTAWSVAAGVTYPFGERGRFAGEVFYTPLEVRRLDDDFELGPEETDELLNVRLLLSWRLR